MREVVLGDLISSADIVKCSENNFPVLSITKSDGIVLQSEKFKKRIASQDITNYKVVYRGQLVQGIHIDEANFGIQDVVDIGIVSPAYKIWDIKSNEIIPKYLEVVLRSPSSIAYYSSKFNGSVKRRERLSNKDFLQMMVPCPSVEEQVYAISLLDKVTDLIALRKQQLSKLDELVKARFVELFGETGKQVPLTDYVWFQEGPGVRSVDFTEDGTILLTGSNINDNTISFGHKSDRHISNELASGKYAHFMCDKDDILVVSSAIDPDKFDKKVVVVDVDKKYCLNTGIIRFKPNKQYLTLGYFREFLKTDYFKHQVSSEMRGIAQMHFGPSHLKQMTILLPDSIERQIEFESFVQQTDKSKLAIQRSLDELETLKKALMQEYFS